MAKNDLMKATDSGGNSMTAFTNNSEMVLAIEGARGPPVFKKRILFSQSPLLFQISKRRASMSQPKTITSGFKSPPLSETQGRGPPFLKKRSIIFRFPPRHPPLYPIVYTERQTTVKGLKKGLYAAEVSTNCTY